MDVDEIKKSKGIRTVGIRRSPIDLSITKDEVRALLTACGEDDTVHGMNARHVFSLMCNIGMRGSECIGIRTEDMAHMATSHSLTIRRLKKRSNVEFIDSVYLSPDEEEMITRIFHERKSPSGKWFSFTLRWTQQMFAAFGRRAGIRPHLSPHSLRRFAAQEIRKAGNSDILYVKLRLGHALDVTERYLAGSISVDDMISTASNKEVFQ